MKRFLILLWIFFIFLVQKSFSQANFSIHAGTTVPVNDFASSDYNNSKSGGAAVGFNLGFQYMGPVSKEGLSLFFGLDLNRNTLQKDVAEETEKFYKDQLETVGINDAPVTLYTYLNIPLSGGLQYTYKLDSTFSVFGNGGFAFNYLKITDFEIELGKNDLIVEFYTANKLGFKIGTGCLIKKKLIVALNYFGIGTQGIEGTMSIGKYKKDIGDYKINVHYLTLTVGYIF